MKPFRLSRRSFLRGTAGATVALPWLEAMTPLGRKAEAAQPKRLFMLVVANGTAPEYFWPTPAGAKPIPLGQPLGEDLFRTGTTALDTTSFTMSPILEPLAMHQQDLLILEGLENCEGYGGHRMYGALLSAVPPSEGSDEGRRARGISMDQVLANHIGKDTKFPSLQFACQCRDMESLFGLVSWYGDAKAAPPVNDPYKMFTRLFGSATPSTDDRLVALVRDEKRSVLDHATARVRALQQKLGAADKDKLERYLESLRGIERQLGAGAGVDAVGCAPPTLPMGLRHQFDTDQDIAPVTNVQIDLAVAAMACDLSRVMTLQIGYEGNDLAHPFLGVKVGHHYGLGHSMDNDLPRIADMIKVGQWHAGLVATIIRKLKAVEVAGGTLFDSSLVGWINGLTKGNIHGNQNQPTVLAGTFGGAFKTGRFIRRREQDQRSYGDLWWEVLRAAGVAVPSFGDRRYFHGGVPEIRA